MENKEYVLTRFKIEDFIETCKKDGVNAEYDYAQLVTRLRTELHSITNYSTFNEDYAETITVYTDEDAKVTGLTLNFEEFLYKVQKMLNIKHINMDEKLAKKQIIERIKLLKTIKTEDNLKEKFPDLYRIFKEGQVFWNNMIAKQRTDDYYSKYGFSMDKRRYFACGLRYRLSFFIDEQVNHYKTIVNKLPEIKDKFNKTTIHAFINRNIDINKANLYLHNRVLNHLEKDTGENKEIKDKYLEIYVAKETDETISYIDKFGNELTFGKFLKRYNNIINLRKLQLDWELLPPGERIKFDRSKKPKKKRKDLSEIDLAPYFEMNDRKLEFYDSLKVIKIAKGNSFNQGYYAMILPNNEIILDKYAKDITELRGCYGNGIYDFNTDNFEDLSPMSKADIRKNKLCPFFTHQGAWEERLNLEVVSKPITEETVNKTEELVRKLEKTN